MSTTFDHPGDLLSAYLDDELTAGQRAAIEEHLGGCEACQTELTEVGEARAVLRGLGDVAVPFGFYERLLRGGDAALEAPRLGGPTADKAKRRFRFGMANIAATAACWALVMGVVNIDHGGDSSVAAADVLEQTASVVPSFASLSRTPAPLSERQEAATYNVPSRLAGTYQLAGFRVVDAQPQALYTDGTRVLTVIVVPGQLDWHRLPEPRPVLVNGDPAWEVRTDDADVILVQRPDAVVVVAGPPSAMAPDLIGGLDPDVPVDDGVLARLEDAGRSLLDTFGLRG